MVLYALPKNLKNVLVVGPIYNRLDKLDELEKILSDFDYVVINDNISFGSENYYSVESSINRRNDLLSTGKVVYNVGGADLIYAGKLDILDPVQSKIEKWIRARPNVVLIDFNGSFQCLVVDGGIPSHITTQEQLTDNIEVSFAPHSHETYSGGLGYVICNSPLTKWAPKFYRYSVQLGNTPEGQVYAFKVDRNGIRRTILL